MKFIIDDINLEKIKNIHSKFYINGININKSVVAEYGEKLYVILEFEKLCGKRKNMLNCE